MLWFSPVACLLPVWISAQILGRINLERVSGRLIRLFCCLIDACLFSHRKPNDSDTHIGAGGVFRRNVPDCRWLVLFIVKQMISMETLYKGKRCFQNFRKNDNKGRLGALVCIMIRHVVFFLYLYEKVYYS